MENSEHKTAEQLAEDYAFQVPYDGTKTFYNDDKYKGFIAGWKACELYSAQQVAEATKEGEKETQDDLWDDARELLGVSEPIILIEELKKRFTLIRK